MPPTLSRSDLFRAAVSHGLEPAALSAVLKVESAGSGYLPDGRLKCLFERHILWKRLLTRGINPKILAQSRPDLCGERWDKRYYRGGAGEYARIEAVTEWGQKHDTKRWESYKKAAYEATSWGLAQIMGFHYERLGFENVYLLKHHAEASEQNQLEQFLRFLETGGLFDELRTRNWISLARQYNGTGQVLIYAPRLALAYAQAKRERWTA